MRKSIYELVTETSHFNPLQLQPRAVLQVSFGSLSRWLREHLVSFPRLIQEHHLSVVILGASIQYEAPLQFFDGDSVRVESSCRLLRKGSRMQLQVDWTGARGRAARASVLLCPVRIDDPLSLGAAPGAIEGALAARFAPDEVDPGSPPRTLPDLRATIETQGTLLAEGTTSFTVYRHLCEVADQWAFTEVPALVGAGREALARRHGAEIPQLSDGLSWPLRSFDMELSRPYFWFQEGTVETRAYSVQGRLALVHRLLSRLPGEEVHGVAIERF